MADTDGNDVDGGEDVVEEQKGQKGKASRDLNNVTLVTEEKELDSSKIGKAMTMIGETNKNEKSQREKDLENVKVQKEDIDIIVNELEISRTQAERALRENNGDLKATLKHLISVN